ncbi:MAG: hypothetical protein ACJ739_17250 [Acidimicrobiales bacterium]
MRRAAALVAVGLVGLGACVWGDDHSEPDELDGRKGLTPVYEATTSTSAPGSTASTATPQGEASTTTTASSVPPRGSTATPRPSAAVTDPAGDATRATGGQPAWADLTGATLIRFDQYFELRVRFGDRAPTSSGSSDKTMNVATFFDVDGDGVVDYEVWANLADGGWDGSWFDDREDRSAFGDDAAMDVVVDGDELRVLFPPQHVGEADAFRWSLASEYGGYSLLGTGDTARDDAPDDDQAVAFPAG